MLLLLQEILSHLEEQHCALQELKAGKSESNERYRRLYYTLSKIIVKLLEGQICQTQYIKPEPLEEEHFYPMSVEATSQTIQNEEETRPKSLAISKENEIPVSRLSFVWKYFRVDQRNRSEAICLICNKVVSRGLKYTTSYLRQHLLIHSIRETSSESSSSEKDLKQKLYSLAWKYFQIDPHDNTRSICKLCSITISRGTCRESFSTRGLWRHLESKHNISKNATHAKPPLSHDDPGTCTSVVRYKPPVDFNNQEIVKNENKQLLYQTIELSAQNRQCKTATEHITKQQNDSRIKMTTVQQLMKKYNTTPEEQEEAATALFTMSKSRKRKRTSGRRDVRNKISQFSIASTSNDTPTTPLQPNPNNDLKVPGRSFVWQYYKINPCNKFEAVCKICEKVVSRGKDFPKPKFTTAYMRHHLAAHSIKEGIKEIKLIPRPAAVIKQRRSHFPWKYFNVDPNNKLMSVCTICNVTVSLGSNKYELKTRNMKCHLLYKHQINNQGISRYRYRGTFVWQYFDIDPNNDKKTICKLCNTADSRGRYQDHLNIKAMRQHLNRKHNIHKHTISNLVIDGSSSPRDSGNEEITFPEEQYFVTNRQDNPPIECSINLQHETANETPVHAEQMENNITSKEHGVVQYKTTAHLDISNNSQSRKTATKSSLSKSKETLHRKSFVWKYYKIDPMNKYEAICLICDERIRRGSKKPKPKPKFITTYLRRHLLIHSTTIDSDQIGSDASMTVSQNDKHSFRGTYRNRTFSDHSEYPRIRARASFVWKYFQINQDNKLLGVCNICNTSVSRGRNPYKLSTSALRHHLLFKHHICQQNATDN